jgi:hypothetical protein
VATLRVRNGPDGAEKRDFRSSPNNGYCQTGSVGPVRAMKRLMRRSKTANASGIGAGAIPSSLAIFRLMVNLNFVG